MAEIDNRSMVESGISVVSSNSSVGDDFRERQRYREQIARAENKAVHLLRVLVLVVLLGSAIAVVVVVYQHLHKQQQEEFETAYQNDATKILEAVGKTLDQTLGSTDSFVVQYMSHAESSNSTWPFVSLPHFGLKAAKLLKLAKAFYCSMTAVVDASQREEWETYANSTKDWIGESLQIQENDPEWTRTTDFDWQSSFNTKIWGIQGPVTEPSPGQTTYLPNWQQHPIIPPAPVIGLPLNFDSWYVAPREYAGIQQMFEQKRVTITQNGVILLPNQTDDEVLQELAARTSGWRAQHLPEGEDATEPASTIRYPMYNNLESIQAEDNNKDHSVVGVFLYVFFWRDLIRDILDSGSNGLVVVFHHECGPSFTYRLNGPATEYLGGGDLHDEKYDGIALPSQTLNEIMRTTTNTNSISSKRGSTSDYTGIPLSETYCPRSIVVYPSQDMENDYVTNEPLLFAIAAAVIFVFTSTIFVVYDCTVARRQRLVMERALLSGEIVSSLFPQAVKEKLYQEKKEEHQRQSNATKFINDIEAANKSILGMGGSGRGQNKPGELQTQSRPIADLFHNTTIMFADLAGFTAWSSKRSPTEVFELLECIYGCFDRVADRMKVFKVETIGDCYVAVTGIPNPQERHALIMVRFARECMNKMRHVLAELAETLGEDTTGLEMRVGLHSGSTTAGVLRGSKGRFQLFGDTVNTASRMESNGVKGKIHVSQATADALIKQGKERWLVQREDQIEAKGKGLMTTYFVKVGSSSGGIATMSTASYSQWAGSSDGTDGKNPETAEASSGDIEAGHGEDDTIREVMEDEFEKTKEC